MQRVLILISLIGLMTESVFAQQPPAIGYMFPAGGKAGQTVEVVLGGYDWTPDIEIFLHDSGIKLEVLDKPGPILVPEPPYWFGKKARRAPFLLPRETKARLTIPTDVPPGIINWQVANANGASSVGKFVVGTDEELVELEDRKDSQAIKTLPVVVSGRVKHIEEVDRFHFTVPQTGPITCSLIAQQIGSPLRAVIEIYDAQGQRIASKADTAGNDIALTFAGERGETYSVHIYDLDFRGNRAFTYRLRIAPEPRVVAAFPTIAQRGETRDVEFIGYGIATGQAKLESLKRSVRFSPDPNRDSFDFQLETPVGQTVRVTLRVSDSPEIVRLSDEVPLISEYPAAITGVLKEAYGEHRFRISAKKGDVLDLALTSEAFESPLDVSLAVYDAQGTQKAQSDDVDGATDAALQFRVPTDGEYQIGVSDQSGNSGQPTAVYRLVVKPAEPGIQFAVPEFLNIPLGGTAKISLRATRFAGFKDPVAISFEGLPEGVTIPDDLEIPAGKTALTIDLTAAADAAATAAVARVIGEAKTDEGILRFEAGPLLVATTITPPFSIDAEGQDDVTKWPRGTIFPAPVLIERDEGFTGEITLEMTSKQGRHRQGIRGPELVVPPGVDRILYPVTLPEWLETTRTSRMVVNGVAQVRDPKGNVRYSVSRQKTRMGFLPTGALLKLSTDADELTAVPGQAVVIPLSLNRSPQLTGPARIEIRPSDDQVGLFSAASQTITANQEQFKLSIVPNMGQEVSAEQKLTIRATVMQEENRPVVSEASVLLLFDGN